MTDAMKAMRGQAVVDMRRKGFSPHRGYFFENAKERGRNVVYIWNDLYIFCRVEASTEEAEAWVSCQLNKAA